MGNRAYPSICEFRNRNIHTDIRNLKWMIRFLRYIRTVRALLINYYLP